VEGKEREDEQGGRERRERERERERKRASESNVHHLGLLCPMKQARRMLDYEAIIS
jgi:hypothetical protein